MAFTLSQLKDAWYSVWGTSSYPPAVEADLEGFIDDQLDDLENAAIWDAVKIHTVAILDPSPGVADDGKVWMYVHSATRYELRELTVPPGTDDEDHILKAQTFIF